MFTWALLCRSQWSRSPWAIYSTMSRIGLVVVQQPKKLRTFWCFPTFFMSSISSINSFLSSSLAFSGDNKDRWVQNKQTNKEIIDHCNCSFHKLKWNSVTIYSLGQVSIFTGSLGHWLPVDFYCCIYLFLVYTTRRSILEVKCCPMKKEQGVEPVVHDLFYLSCVFHIVFDIIRLKKERVLN